MWREVKTSLERGLLTDELNNMIMHDRSFEVPLFLCVTAYALPFGAQTSLEIFQMIFSIGVMTFSMAKFLVESELGAYLHLKEEADEDSKLDKEEHEDLNSNSSAEETGGLVRTFLCGSARESSVTSSARESSISSLDPLTSP